MVCFLNYLLTIVAQLSPKLDLSFAPLVLVSNAATKHPWSLFQNKTKSTWRLRSTLNIILKLQISTMTKFSYLKAKTQLPISRLRSNLETFSFYLKFKTLSSTLSLDLRLQSYLSQWLDPLKIFRPKPC